MPFSSTDPHSDPALRNTLKASAARFTLSEETRDRLDDETILAVTENPGLVDPDNIEQSLALVIENIATDELQRGNMLGHDRINLDSMTSIHKAIAGKTVLVVADDIFQANEITIVLSTLGAGVKGPFPDMQQGMGCAKSVEIDIAILDVKLGSETTYELADLLLEKKTQVVFLTSSDNATVPKRFSDVPLYIKPLPIDVLPSIVALALLTGERQT